MEAAEATAAEAAIVWRAQTILETLQLGELDAWIHGVGLDGAIGELKSEVERMETVVNGVKGRSVGNKPLARSLARVKQLVDDADGVVDELDYCRLQQQRVQGVMLAPAIELEAEGMVGDGAVHVDASGSTAGIPNNNCRKNRSKERDYFHITPAVNGEPSKAKCIDCGTEVLWGHGTSVLRKHRNSARCKNNKRAAAEEAPNCPSAGDSVQNGAIMSTDGSVPTKRMRTVYDVPTTAPTWDKAKFLERIQGIALELGSIRGYVIEYLKDSVASSHYYQSNTASDAQVRTSGSLPGKVYGRHEEKQYIIGVIKYAKSSDNITVLPIVGIVGVGKTALAKLVYNDLLVKNQFERIWVSVSSIFDEVRVTREILDAVTLNNLEGSPHDRGSYGGGSNYTKLQEVLKARMACQPKKLLLVLDDVNDCMDDSRWKDLLAALGSSCTKGNVIIVTARNFSIAERIGTVKPLKLGALKDGEFWHFFKSRAFGDNIYHEHLDIGRQIAAKLQGNPLAAESAGDMLREQPTIHHWKSIMKNGVWESLQLRGGIVTALKISYYQLPYHLQQCLLFCSIFPNGYLFHIEDLVYMWISSGFVKSAEIGRGCLNDLVNSGFFEHVETHDSIVHHQICYVMSGIMHEFARLVSRDEFATMDGLECKVLPTVRHFSILIDSVHHEDECGTMLYNGKFEEKLKSIVSLVRRLRTLILIGHYDTSFLQSFHTVMFSVVNCTHLRYLKLENKGSNEAFHISLSSFYHLEVLDVRQPVIVYGTSDLVNMRNLVLSKRACGACSTAWFTCLQTIHLEDCEGWETLPSLESLSSLTKLKLKNMHEVAELSIPSLGELVLIDMPKLERCSSSSVRDLNSSLRVLDIRRCQVLKAFPLFESYEKIGIEQKSWLTNLSELTIHECPHLLVSNPLPPSSRSCKLSIQKVSGLPDMEGSPKTGLSIGPLSSIEFLGDEILSFHNLITITQLQILGFRNLWSISLEGLRQLVCLKRLEIRDCPKILSWPVSSMQAHEDMAATDFDALPSLVCLSISHCGITGEWLSFILQHVRALEELHLIKCEQIAGLLMKGKESSLSNLTSAPRASSQGNVDGASTRPCPDKLLRVPSNLVLSLKKMNIEYCGLKFQGNKEAGFSGFTCLEKLVIFGCAELMSSLVDRDEIDDQANGRWLVPSSLGVLDIIDASLGNGDIRTLQRCFPGDLTRLTVLKVWEMEALESLQLHFCTALEKLTIKWCESLEALEGVQSLCSLRYLKVHRCPGLPQCLESLSLQGYGLCPRLERLQIDQLSFLTTPFCKHLTSLQSLQIENEDEDTDAAGLTCEQEAALQLLTSLQELRFVRFYTLSDLPVGLHSLPSLERLEISSCGNISRLPERGLPPLLEELEVRWCSEELTEQCRMLVTTKLKVKIDGKYVD